jgi:hypothetical protein
VKLKLLIRQAECYQTVFWSLSILAYPAVDGRPVEISLILAAAGGRAKKTTKA